MHLILLSGGSGKRLWPLSNDVRSKQFLQILNDPNGKPESMVQRVYRQIKEIGGWKSITVVASKLQKDQLLMQLDKEVNIVIEPERRDTFPAIVLACSYLYNQCDIKANETIIVLPVDSFVELNFFKNITKIPSILNDSENILVLIGAEPTFPSQKYGYIVAESSAEIATVEYFKEKPDAIIAKGLIENGALWNCGVFGLKANYIIQILKDRYGIVDLSFENILNKFKTLKKISFDYEVVEHADKIKVLKYPGEWKDLGTWETLSEEMKVCIMGNVKTDNSCENTHVINEYDIPIITMGLKNMVVVASHDGILVAEKGETPRLKEFVGDLQNRPMYEEKRWGTYQVLNHTFHPDGTESLTKKLCIRYGRQISYQKHENRKEVWTVITGNGWICIDEKCSQVSAGDTITIWEKQAHALYASTDIELIEIQMGNPLIEEDIIRIAMEFNWEEQFLDEE